MTFMVRRATAADAPALTALAHAAKAHWGYPAEWLASWREELTLGPTYLAAHEVFVADASGAASPIGVCALEDHEAHWELGHLWVSPAAQRMGVGSTLVRHALSVAAMRRPGTRVRVEADPHAAEFYRRLGAREVGLRPAPMPGVPTRALPVLEFSLSDV